MNCTIYPGVVRGTIDAPCSKSYAQRAIFAASLARGESILDNFQYCDDNWVASINAAMLGAEIRHFGNQLYINSSKTPRQTRYYSAESGLSSRILSCILMTLEGNSILEGSGSLTTRPFDPIFEVFDLLDVSYESNGGLLPLKIGTIQKITDITIDGSLSSQFITGLLIALASIGFDRKIIITNPKSKGYIDMTIDLLTHFGVKWEETEPYVFQLSKSSLYAPCNYNIEGDWSGAAFLLVAGLVAGDVKTENLDVNSKQADRSILDLDNDLFEIKNGTIRTKYRKIPSFRFDATDCPDLFPPLAVLAASAEGPSIIKGTSRLGHKESDRAKVLQQEFAKLWIRIDLSDDEMYIQPSKPAGGIVNAHNDHRIAMALSILALSASEPVTIKGVECVSKSYPGFFEDLRKLGVSLEMIK